MSRLKTPSIKSLQKKAEKLWKDLCRLRDGNTCQVLKYYPNIEITHTDVIQVDHCISRANKMLFLNPGNGTTVCSACNQAKHYKLKSVHRAIDQIVIQREGMAFFKTLVNTDMIKAINHDWSKRWWIEMEIEKLTRRIDALKNERTL